jgi:Tat protein secretion system quality control protein TatD with DNase activity
MSMRENLQQLPLDELIAESDRVIARLTETKRQLDEAKAYRLTTGEYADPDWYSRATHAARLQGRLHQTLLQVIAEKKSELRAKKTEEKNTSDNAAFVAAARQLLTPEQYQAIWRAVNNGLLEGVQ